MKLSKQTDQRMMRRKTKKDESESLPCTSANFAVTSRTSNLRIILPLLCQEGGGGGDKVKFTISEVKRPDIFNVFVL